MLRRINFYSICFAFGLSVLLILAGSRYTDNVNYHPSSDSRKNAWSFIKPEDGEDLLHTQRQQSKTPNPYEESINVILEKTRSKIKLKLSNCNLTISGANKLEDLTLETGGRPVTSIIVSTWRSGTTFLGEILNAVPGTFYFYEPLLKYGIIQIRGPPHADSAVRNIKKMLKCDYSDMDDFFDYGKTHLYQFNHNLMLWDHCKFKKELCYDANFTARFCKLFPFQSMKVVRLRLNLIEDVLLDKELNAKVILLVRDPRGVMESRQHRDFCKTSLDCWQAELLCADMISDYVAAGRLSPKYPDKLMVLRYEELALTPNVTTHQLLKFLNLGAVQSVDEFLHTHTNVDSGGLTSTFRVSRDVPFKWTKLLNYTFVEEIQGVCKVAMSLWGYKLADNATHMTSKEFNPLEPYSVIP